MARSLTGMAAFPWVLATAWLSPLCLVVGVGPVLQSGVTSRLSRLTTAGLAAWSFGLSVLGVLSDYQRGWQTFGITAHGLEPMLWPPPDHPRPSALG